MFKLLEPMYSPEIDGDGTPVEPVVTPGENPEIKPFDPNGLDEETKKYIDQQRTNASKTAAENAKKKLQNDPDFIKSIREQVELEANKTAEEKLADRERELEASANRLAVQTNKLNAKEKLLTSGITGLDVDTILDVITTTDAEITMSNVELLVASVDTLVTARVAKEKEKLLQGGFEVQTGTGNTATLQQLYDEAKKANNQMAKIKIKQEAASKGVAIQE